MKVFCPLFLGSTLWWVNAAAQDDNLKFVGNAFQIDPPSNIVWVACFDSSYQHVSHVLFLFAGVFVWKHAVDRTIWRRCRPQTEFHSFCFRTLFRREVTHRPHLQHLLWVHVLRSRPMLCLGQRWVQDKSDSDESQNCVPQDHQGFVPPHSLLVAVASMTKQDGAFQTNASTCCTLLLRTCRMESGLGKMKKRQSIVARPSPALGVLFFQQVERYLLAESLFATLDLA